MAPKRKIDVMTESPASIEPKKVYVVSNGQSTWKITNKEFPDGAKWTADQSLVHFAINVAAIRPEGFTTRKPARVGDVSPELAKDLLTRMGYSILQE